MKGLGSKLERERIKKQKAREKEEKKLKLLEKKVYRALKGEKKITIRKVCNRISKYISETSSREKRISELNKELNKLKSKK